MTDQETNQQKQTRTADHDIEFYLEPGYEECLNCPLPGCWRETPGAAEADCPLEKAQSEWSQQVAEAQADARRNGYVNSYEAAERLATSRGTVSKYVQRGRLTDHAQIAGRHELMLDPAEVEAVRIEREAELELVSRYIGVTEASTRLGLTPGQLNHMIETGKLHIVAKVSTPRVMVLLDPAEVEAVQNEQ